MSKPPLAHIQRIQHKNLYLVPVSVTRSPMNARRWYVELPCGHETRLTASSKPRKAKCEKSDCNYWMRKYA